jgi:hypothetical protein
MNLDCGALVTSTDATATATRIFFPPHLRLIGFAGLNINLDRPLSSCARRRRPLSSCARHRRHRDSGKNYFFITSSVHRLRWPEHEPRLRRLRHIHRRHRDGDKIFFPHIFGSSVSLAGTSTWIAPCRHVRATATATAVRIIFCSHLRFVGCAGRNMDLECDAFV